MMKKMTPEELEIARVKKQRSKIYLFAPGTFSMIGGMPIEAFTSGETFATDGEKIYVNVEYSKTKTDLEIRGIIIHEGRHKSSGHHLRRPEWCPHDVWNIACDYSINGDIRASANYGIDFVLPDDGLFHEKYSTNGWAVERIAKELMASAPDQPDQPDEEGEPGDEGGDKVSERVLGKSCGEVLDAPVNQSGTKEDVKRAMEELQEELADAELVEKAMGVGKGDSMVSIAAKELSKTCSSRLIRPFLQKSFMRKRSWKKPNKRFSRDGNYFPGRTKVSGDLVCCIDSSGSVGIDEFERFQSTIINAAMELEIQKVKIAFVDDFIHINAKTGKPWFEYDLTSGGGPKAFKMDVFGGGGTSFDPIFNYINKSRDDVRALIYMTDGFGHVNVTAPNYPVMWLTTHQSPYFKNRPFGQIVYI